MTKELEGLEKRPERGNTHRFTHKKKIKLENDRPWWYTWILVQETHLHSHRVALEMNTCLQGEHIPEWMTKEKTTLIQKDPLKRTALNNYRPITCLPMTGKILTAQIRKEIYNSLTSRTLFPEEQKEFRKNPEVQNI